MAAVCRSGEREGVTRGGVSMESTSASEVSPRLADVFISGAVVFGKAIETEIALRTYVVVKPKQNNTKKKEKKREKKQV